METSIWKEYEISSNLYLNKPEFPVKQGLVKCKKPPFCYGLSTFWSQNRKRSKWNKKGSYACSSLFWIRRIL